MGGRLSGAGAQPIRLPPGARRLVMCFDGTWNSIESQTNVLRLFRSLASVETACPEQLTFYEEGVGTERGNQFRGGMLGRGLDRNILDGYCWLINNYHPGRSAPDRLEHVDGELPQELVEERFCQGDLIFLTGFSRGAYTARSLAGMINLFGIPVREKMASLKPGEPARHDTPEVQEAWTLYQKGGGGLGRYDRQASKYREERSHNAKIACVAVWDTVGALGLPHTVSLLSFLSRRKYAFHDTRLGRVIEHAYHAVAIDEHRPDFDVTLWTLAPDEIHWARDVEQRWFPGAHANVGGGYDDDLLCEAPLFWMAERLAALGVVFRRDRETPPFHAVPPPEFRPDGNEYLSPVRDSYGEFMGGWYALARRLLFRRRLRRQMMLRSRGVAQVIDPSARLKWDLDPDYRPRNLAKAGRTDAAPPRITIEDLVAVQGLVR